MTSTEILRKKILDTITQFDGIGTTELAELTETSRGRMFGHLKVMEKRGDVFIRWQVTPNSYAAYFFVGPGESEPKPEGRPKGLKFGSVPPLRARRNVVKIVKQFYQPGNPFSTMVAQLVNL
jgi:hypothetical protein